MQRSFRLKLFFCFFLSLTVAAMIPAIWLQTQLRLKATEEAYQEALGRAYQMRSMLELTDWDEESLAQTITALSGSLTGRMTLIDENGYAVADSYVYPPELAAIDIHRGQRGDITQALERGYGVAIYESLKLGQEFVFASIRIPDGLYPPPMEGGGVLRVIMPISSTLTFLDRSLHNWMSMLLAVLLASLLLSWALSRSIEDPIREMGNVIRNIADGSSLTRRLHILPNREFADLASSVNEMADRIETSIKTIEAQKAQLETILQVMEEGVLVIGPRGRIRMVNDKLIKLFPQAVGAVGRHPIEVVPSPELQKSVDLMLLNPDEDDNHSISLQIEPNRDVILSVQVVRPRTPVHDVAAVVVFHDITELMKLMRIRRDFVANVSHELRTPLTSIQGYAETLAELRDDEEAMREKCIKTILRNTGQMGGIVEDLLILARLESDSLPLDMDNVSLNQLARQIAQNLEHQAEACNLGIVIDIPEEFTVRADAHFLGQVFRNLIDNACRFGSPGTNIEVSAIQSGDDAIVTILDHGPGVQPDALNRVFERFYRYGPRKSGTSSTGLGLAICKHVVERHDGRIWVENTPGAAFRFTLPLIDPADDGADTGTAPEKNQAMAAGSGLPATA